MPTTQRSKPKTETGWPDSGVWAPTGLRLRCAACRATAERPNPEAKSLMMLVIAAEEPSADGSPNWYIPMGGGPVLCPRCHGREAARVGALSFLGVRTRSHTIDQKATIRTQNGGEEAP